MSLSQCPTSWENCSEFQWKRTLTDDCNPVMSDGRIFTNYKSSSMIDNSIARKHNLTNSNDMRAFLQRNGPAIVEKQKHRSVKAARCHLGAEEWLTKFDVSLPDNEDRFTHYKSYDESYEDGDAPDSKGLTGLGSELVTHASPVYFKPAPKSVPRLAAESAAPVIADE